MFNFSVSLVNILETRRFANLLNVQACKQVIYANLETFFCFKSKHVVRDSLVQIKTYRCKFNQKVPN